MKRFNKVLKSFFVVTFVASLLLTTGCNSSKVSKEHGKQLVMDSAIKQGKLDNGMSYFIRENGEPKNRIQLRLVVKAGSCMEDEDQKGVAHFIEHLCFNGTEHFEKSAIVDYFETIGMSFGPEVNAYTSFEETVYMLEVPADDIEMLKTSLLVLHDWASAVSFESEEIEKERGVIIEEWRSRYQSVNGRAFFKELDLLLKGSRYADRITIGDMDVIRNIKRDRILDFYNKWYRPENMAVVAVGDIKPGVLESAIKEIMGEIPASDVKTEVPEYSIPKTTEKNLEVMRDKELTVTEAYIFENDESSEPLTTVEQLRKEYALNFAADIFNQRCQVITSSPDAAWLWAGIGKGYFVNQVSTYMLQFFPKAGMFNESMKGVLDELERFINFGVTDSELERSKKSYIRSLEQNYKNKEKHSSAVYTDSIVSYVLTGRILISDEDDLKLGKQIINSITSEEIVEAVKNIYKNRGTKMFVVAPESIEIPSEKEIKDLWENYESEAAKQAYVDDLENDQLMQRPAKKAKVTEKKAIKELGGTQYTFENGVKILTKKTDFKKDTINFFAGSKGGYYYVNEEDIPSAKIAGEYVVLSGFGDKTYSQILKIASTKNLNVNVNLSNTTESFTGSASMNNLEESLQIINLVFSQPKFTEDGWKTLIDQYKQVAETYGSRPEQVYSDKIREVLYGNTLYTAPWNKDYIAKMNPETAERIFKERFANPADFTFVFVGDFDEKKLVELCSYYLGTLKTDKNFEETKYVYFPFPTENKTLTVEKGIDQKGQVYICFGGELDKLPEQDGIEIGFKESEIINQLASLLDIRLREVIREDKGGSYGVGTGGYIDGYPERFYQVYIEFGCEPEREQELSDAVIDTVKEIKAGNISDEMIIKLKESYTRSIETALRNNNWWINRFGAEVLFTYEPLWFTSNSNQVADWITKEALVEAANKYLNTEKVVTAYLKPENK